MLFLKTLSVDDGWDIFDMLKEIGTTENSFTNPVHEMTYEQFKKWLIQQEKWSREEDLPPGYVGQTIYWLYDGERPVGFGKIRHQLTEASRRSGGSIGYAIRPQCRRKGYGKAILRMLLVEAKRKRIKELLLTVDKGNIASKKVIEGNNGILIYENGERWYFKIP